MRGLFSQDDQLSSRELTEISCGLTILSFTVLILLYTFVVLCCTFYERNLRCGRTLGIHLPTGSPRYTGISGASGCTQRIWYMVAWVLVVSRGVSAASG